MPDLADFMAMYPAYTLEALLNTYAISFYALLAEGRRIRAKHYEMLAIISDLPSTKDEYRKEFYRSLGWATMHPSDILKPRSARSNPDDIKKILGGN